MGLAIGLGIAAIAFIVITRGSGLTVQGQGSIFAARTISPNIGTYVNPAGGPNTNPYGTYNPNASYTAGMAANGASGSAGPSTADTITAVNLEIGAGAAQGFATGGPVGAAVGATVATVKSLFNQLAQHKARMAGATNENNAALVLVPVMDSFLNTVVNGENSGQYDNPSAAAALAAFDQYLYAKLRGLVGAPGTAWSDQSGIAGKCDKTCTVGCCLYFGDLGPPLSLVRYVLGDAGGRWGAQDPRLSGRTVTVPKVYPGKYSSYTRPSYTVTIQV